MQLKKQRISIEMMQYFSIKKKSVPIVLPGQNILIGTKHIEREKKFFTRTKFFHQNKIFSPGQNFFAGTKFFTADQFNMEVDKPQRIVFAFFGASGKENASFERKSSS